MLTCIRALAVSAFITVCFPVPGFASITGTVSDTQCNPVSGALVTFTDESDPEQYFSTYTDEFGNYEIALTTTVEEDAPTSFSLGQNYPNPFNPSTTIPFTLDTSGHVSLTIYNIMGQRVRSLLNSHMQAGLHTVVWDGMDEQGDHVSAGVYLYRLRSGTHVESKKMLLLDGGILNGFNSSGIVRKKSVTNETTSYHISVRVYGFTEYKESGIQLYDGSVYDCELTEMMRIHNIPFVSIPGGTFQMGDVENAGTSDEKPVHTVTVSSFEMSAYEITNAQYAQYLNEALTSGEIEVLDGDVYGKTGEWSGERYLDIGYEYTSDNKCWIEYTGGTFSVTSGKESWPVVAVTWYGAKAFTEYYGIDLPREAEWEYACRWGNHQYMYGTDDGTINGSKANYDYLHIFNPLDDMHTGHPVAVGSYPANPFGLQDMSGNVWEWCADWFGNYTSESVIDPTGAQSGIYRVGRGGAWFTGDYMCWSAYRVNCYPYQLGHWIGFRVVRRDAQQ